MAKNRHLAGGNITASVARIIDQSGGLSADPAKDIQHFTGRMALKLLLATLLVSPLARYSKQPLLLRCRRLLGYGVLPGEHCIYSATRYWNWG